ncbi:MAG: diguanylate cyclase [Burkholderiales bacterium]|nr:diguanylate cyclase [Burkholderiales bacterium]
MKNLSTRARIAILIVASALPILALVIYSSIMQREVAEHDEQQELRLIAELVAKRPEQLMESAHQLLIAIGSQADHLLADRVECHRYFRRLLPEGGGLYRAMGLTLPSGDVFCSSTVSNSSGSVNVRDRSYFRMAVESGKFSVGEYQVGRVTGSSGINFAYPVMNADGSLQVVAFAGLNIETFIEQGESRREGLRSALGRMVTILDRNNVVLAQYPTTKVSIGEKHPNPRVIEALSRPGNSLFAATDQDGVSRLYAVENVGMNPDGIAPLRVIVSVPSHMIFAEADQALLRTTFGILVITILLVVVAWFGAEILVLRRVRTLLDVADRIRTGDLAARAGFGKGDEELTRLGSAFDAMAQELQIRDTELQDALQRLNHQAATDHLTGLPNRRYLWEALGAELMRARRKKTPLALMLLDIDHFKKINDCWGHEAGDLVLKNVTYAIRAVVRGSDLVARHGGEEFVVVLPEAAEDIALARAEAVRIEIAGLKLTYGGQSLGTITASIGIAVSRELRESAEGLVRIADLAMYEAKQGGRNRVVIKNADTETTV